MNTLLIVYGTTEGHTITISEHIADKAIHSLGYDVDICDSKDRLPDPSKYDYVIIASSVHAGEYPKSSNKVLQQYHQSLNTRPSAFVSVSLTAAGIDQKAWKDLKRKTTTFIKSFNWHPRQVHYAAGALIYRKYGFLKRFLMKRIAKASGGDDDTSKNYVYTDWKALDNFTEEFLHEKKVAL